MYVVRKKVDRGPAEWLVAMPRGVTAGKFADAHLPCRNQELERFNRSIQGRELT